MLVLRRFHVHALCCVLLLFVVQAVVFAVMLILLQKMQAEVTDLDSVGEAPALLTRTV